MKAKARVLLATPPVTHVDTSSTGGTLLIKGSTTAADTPLLEDLTDLTEGFERLKAVRRLFESQIKKLVDAYYISTELTDKTGSTWHWHLHAVAYGRRFSGSTLIDAWVRSAHELGINAGHRGQRHSVKTPEDALKYAVKARLGNGTASLRGLATRASEGDADADERWEQVQRFYLDNPSRRWRSSWVQKPAAPTRVTALTSDYSDSPDLRRLVILDSLNIRGKRNQADFLRAAIPPEVPRQGAKRLAMEQRHSQNVSLNCELQASWRFGPQPPRAIVRRAREIGTGSPSRRYSSGDFAREPIT